MTGYKKIISVIVVVGTLAVATISIQPDSREARIVFISDTHASADAKDRDLQWNTNSFSRIKQIFEHEESRPTHLVWLGDIVDFLPSEWNIAKSWVDWIRQNNPSVKQHAVMGNHDYLYYNYPEIQGAFNNAKLDGFMSTEIESSLIIPVNSGDMRLFVRDAKQFVEGRQILLIETPDHDTSNQFHIGVIKHVDTTLNSIELTEPLKASFVASSTAVRQGFTEKRGISYFLTTFAQTETQSTKQVFFIGNTCFVLMSMDRFFDFDPRTVKTRAIPEEDFQWFEEQLAKYHKTHNIVVAMHEMPDSGKALGNLHDPNDVIDFDRSTRDRLMKLIARYQITAWVSGHTHPDARRDVVHSKQLPADFLLVPSLGMNPEGQALIAELRNGAETLDFQYWSTDKRTFFRKISVPLKHKVAF